MNNETSRSKAISNLCYQLRGLGYYINTKTKIIRCDSIMFEDMPRINKLIHAFNFKISHDSQSQTLKPVRYL